METVIGIVLHRCCVL